MAFDYGQFVSSGIGKQLATTLGLPRPSRLRRHKLGGSLVPGEVLVAGHGDAPVAERVRHLLADAGVTVASQPSTSVAGVVLDLTAIESPADLETLRGVVGPALKTLAPTGRVIVIGRPPQSAASVEQAAARRAVEGIVRSVGKEMRGGGTANTILVAEDADAGVDATVRFLLSGRSAYVSGQVFSVTAPVADVVVPSDWDQPLAGKVAVVTGAARGIGAAIAQVMARDGAHVVAVDIPAAGDKLAEVANGIGGTALQLDITADDAPQRLVEHLKERHGGADVVVHNAGITRDKLLVNMDAARWNSVMAVNLQAQLDITQALLDADGVLNENARIVCVSSQSGIAGNRGQTNYAASKAGVIGMVRAWAPAFAERGATINAVAPGFIVTEMTAKMPFGTREVGSRINSLQQGGLPVDVAETIAWLSQPGSAGVNGQTVRVCGQSMLGA